MVILPGKNLIIHNKAQQSTWQIMPNSSIEPVTSFACHLQVAGLGAEATSRAGSDCNTFCHPAERGLFNMQPRRATHASTRYSPLPVPGKLDFEE